MLGEYMEAALAEALGLSVEEFQALKADEGFNIADYAVEQDMTVAELQEWLQEVYTNAIQIALEDGAITQDQADSLLENLENFDGRLPFGPFFPGR
jgi:2-oxoglutarate dehydrogenase complex dehydrogenase (E1) component-like enzyme